MAVIDPDKLKRDANGKILRSELLRINKPALRKLPLQKRRTIVRWLRGKKYWNAWAEEMLDRRKEMEEAGKWQAEKQEFDISKGLFFPVEKGLNSTTQAWLDDAVADFSGLDLLRLDRYGEITTKAKGSPAETILVEDIGFRGLPFPGVTDFRDVSFSGDANFEGTTFSGNANFRDTTFSGDAYFQHACFSGNTIFQDTTFSNGATFWGTRFSDNVNFSNVTFFGASFFTDVTFFCEATFRNATFSGDVAFFLDTIFSGNADFRSVTFSGNAYFRDATFSGAATFQGATFPGTTNFEGTTFSSGTSFMRATFSGNVGFAGATFSGDVSFRLATFEKPVDFSGAGFRKKADFSSIHSKRSFDLRDARFRVAPDFSQAAFHAPPALDEVRVAEQLRKRGGPPSFRSLPGVTREKALDVSRRFRALGKMAHEARDWLNEMEFFAQEIRTRRFGLDFPLGEWRGPRKGLAWLARKWRLKPLRGAALRLARWINASSWCGPRVGRFWFGWFYEALSRFGRSFARPFWGWVVSMFGFAALYWWRWAQETASFGDALAVSFRQGLVISGLTRSGHYQHLLAEVFGAIEGGPNIPDLPHWLFFWMNAQTAVSAFFLFLLLLAARNHFRIR